MTDEPGTEEDLPEIEFVDRAEFDALVARVKEIEDAIEEAANAKAEDLADDVGEAAESAVRRGLKKLFG